MRALPQPLRKQLETAVLAARRAAESASRAAIDGLGVFNDRRPEHLTQEQAALRNGLRAKWRQLGSDREQLVGECAYEQWHRLLFARFLAENSLLIHPKYRAPVTLAECGEYAPELAEPDGWFVAARFASEILPGIFRLDDPCVRLRLAPEGRHALEQAVEALPKETFIADDSLGWVYQFWQTDTKDAVNASERKIGGADLGPVTQLFTENYMVRFLLENSLGAWWAARHPNSPLLHGFDFLRVADDGLPAAGKFEDWPDRVAAVTVMDPCCGSGHFLIEAFNMLWPMRVEEEGITAVEAQDAVLRDNLFGLELDPRCVQIAMFALAFQAWKTGGGWRQISAPHISCSGMPVTASVDEWTKLAQGDARLENALTRLHTMFRDAETLGSLIDPRRSAEAVDPRTLQPPLDHANWEEIAPLLAQAAEREGADPAMTVLGEHAAAVARAADLLSRSYTLVATNVPWLKRGNQSDVLARFCDIQLPLGRADLATAFLTRCIGLLDRGGTLAAVSPQAWLTLGSFMAFRQWMLSSQTWRLLARLGPGAFETISGEAVKPVLAVTNNLAGPSEYSALAIDSVDGVPGKQAALRVNPIRECDREVDKRMPDSRVTLVEAAQSTGMHLSDVAESYVGMQTSDDPRYTMFFWELAACGTRWERLQDVPTDNTFWSGCTSIVRWEQGSGPLTAAESRAWQGRNAWGRSGVIVARFGRFLASLYLEGKFHQNAAVIVPSEPSLVRPILAFCQSEEFEVAVRKIDQQMKVTNASLVKVPFALEHWRKVAEAEDPVPPEASSDDPTQWLFKGRPEASTAPLQVAVGRLVGYRWPEQPKSDDLDAFVDADGIVCLPPVAGEPPAVDRLQEMLAAAFDDAWSAGRGKELLEQAGSKKKTLADWLHDEFFKQHCALFENRPFVWHVSDGQRDGLSALVNYHRLDRKKLEKLTYTYLGQDWVERQRADAREEVAGAEARLAAALELQRKLEAILKGEKPYDIYVRWKALHEQPMGWEPDLNDGIRLNIRPFVKADVLKTFSPWPFKETMWKKDRGKNPDGSERHNDLHFTLAEKREARNRAGRP